MRYALCGNRYSVFTIQYSVFKCMTPDDLRQQIELAVVELIKKTRRRHHDRIEVRLSLKTCSICLNQACRLKKLYRALPKLDDAFPESPLSSSSPTEYEDHITQQASSTVSELIKRGPV